MNRRKFLQNSCAACLSATALSGILSSCQATRYVAGSLGKDGLTIDINEFILKGNKKEAHRSFLIVRNDALQYPICIYRFNENEYTALWMSCTHQGAELQASGDRLQCTAHGSEFTNQGKVTNGPADKDLRSFPVTINNDQLFIDLKAV
jgi:Rieske Fe-S protein